MYILLIILVCFCCYLIWMVSVLKKNSAKQVDSTNGLLEYPNKSATFESTQSYNNYFVSKEAEIIFALLYTEEEKRTHILDISEAMYESLVASKNWRNSLLTLIHPDRCSHPDAALATSKINDIYSRMVKYGE